MKRLLVSSLVFSTILGTVLSLHGKVTVQNGGYSNVLVSFAQNVQEKDAKTALLQLQTQLNEASRVLHSSIGLRIADVTVVIPRSWDTSSWEENVQNPSSTSQSHAKADIVVTSVGDSVLGQFPHAVQYGSCGTPGLRILIPTDFIVGENTKYPKGLAIAREWLKYRYGVFDENGFPGDELYPLYYRIPGMEEGEAIVTDCSNERVEYEYYDGQNNCLKEELFSKACTPEPVEDSLEKVTSSLMYFHKRIPQMQHVCGRNESHPHASLARNKHNALCSGQSVWDVLKKSSDFQHLQSSADDASSEDIEFKYVLEPRKKVVIAWENTEHLKKQGNSVLNIVRKFVYDLPKGTKRALYPFVKKFDEKNSVALSELVNWPADWKFPGVKSTFSNPSEGCVECALNNSMEVLDSDQSDVGEETIILIASSNVKESDDIIARIQATERCLMLLIFSDDETLEGYEKLAKASKCGSLRQIRSDFTSEDILNYGYKMMESFLPETVNDKRTDTIKSLVLREKEPYEIYIYSYMEKVAFWIFSPIEMDSVKADFEDSEVVLDEEIFDNIIELTFTPTTTGSLKFHLNYGGEVLMQVRVTSKPGEYASGDIFIQALSEEKTKQKKPVVILYANVHYGGYPLQNAEVSIGTNPENPYDESTVFKLLDSGTGDPDIAANDGIYSRYFRKFNQEEYSVIVLVKGNETTRMGKIAAGGELPLMCCGQSAKEGLPMDHHFYKVLTAKFRLSESSANRYSPSRITDLRINSVNEENVTLVWTAPGGDLDYGKADDYHIKYFKSNKIEDFREGNLLKKVKANKRGIKEEILIEKKLFESDGHYFLAVQATAGIFSSEISNVAEVYVSNSHPNTNPTPEPQLSDQKRIVIIVTSSILGIIVLVILLYFIIYKVVKRQKKAKPVSEAPIRNSHQKSNENQLMNPVTFVPVDTLIRHHNDKTRAKLEHKEPRILKQEDFQQSQRKTGDAVVQMDENQENRSSEGDTRHEGALYPPKSPKKQTHV